MLVYAREQLQGRRARAGNFEASATPAVLQSPLAWQGCRSQLTAGSDRCKSAQGQSSCSSGTTMFLPFLTLTPCDSRFSFERGFGYAGRCAAVLLCLRLYCVPWCRAATPTIAAPEQSFRTGADASPRKCYASFVRVHAWCCDSAARQDVAMHRLVMASSAHLLHSAPLVLQAKAWVEACVRVPSGAPGAGAAIRADVCQRSMQHSCLAMHHVQ